MKLSVFWFRRDLRLEDNTGLAAALCSGKPVLPLFIFDSNITDELSPDDPRLSFIYKTISGINEQLLKKGSALCVLTGDPLSEWKRLASNYDIGAVYLNKDYEPYAVQRDKDIENLLKSKGIPLVKFKDQVIFEEGEVLKPDGKPYTVFTPYKNRWLKKFSDTALPDTRVKEDLKNNYYKGPFLFPDIRDLTLIRSSIQVKPYDLSVIQEYHRYRDLPAADRTSYLSPHLRFGTVSIRDIARTASALNSTFLNELIWREFFMQILFHFPHVVTGNFKPDYDDIEWRNDEREFRKWCNGETGFPIVDAGMRQLNETGNMHNRVRMIVAGFLCKDLLIDWRWGEAYFAGKLLDYELSSNNGNWQWAGGTGCDAAAYFRVFHPDTQQKRFDPHDEYVKRWLPDLGKSAYPQKMVDHDFARQRAITTYKAGIRKTLYK